jgi:hypothetical protein
MLVVAQVASNWHPYFTGYQIADRGIGGEQMYPYQLSKVLADQRINDRVAAADRHQMIARATARSTATAETSTRLRTLMRQVLAPFQAGHRASAGLTRTSGGGSPAVTSGSEAGPMGCVA